MDKLRQKYKNTLYTVNRIVFFGQTLGHFFPDPGGPVAQKK